MAIQHNPYLSPLRNLTHTTYRAPSVALPSSMTELGAVARNIGQAIGSYSKKIHNSLEDWYHLSQELNDLLKFAKPLVELLITLKKISTGSDNVTISGKEAATFLELGHLLGDNYTKNVHVTDVSLTTPDEGIWELQSNSGGEQLYYLYQQTKNLPLKDCTNIKITLSPSDAQGTENQLSIALSKNGYDLGSLSGISQAVTKLKHSQNKDLFKVMSFSNAKKSNEKGLSSVMQLLKSISSTALSNLQ